MGQSRPGRDERGPPEGRTHPMSVEIVPVEGIGKFLAFCRLPRQIYKGMPGFAPPLDAERWTNFAPSSIRISSCVESQAFLAK